MSIIIIKTEHCVKISLRKKAGFFLFLPRERPATHPLRTTALEKEYVKLINCKSSRVGEIQETPCNKSLNFQKTLTTIHRQTNLNT